MRTILALCVTILAVGGFLLWRSMQLPTTAGTFSGAPKAEVVALLDRPTEFVKKTVLVEGEVRHQCKAMGCFFFFSVGDRQLRVDLEQIAMNAPMREGRPARVEGQMIPYADGYQLLASAVEFQ